MSTIDSLPKRRYGLDGRIVTMNAQQKVSKGGSFH